MTEDIPLAERIASLPGYAIRRELGGGGMSRVFLAEELALSRRVAIKVLDPAGARVDGARFRHEVMVSARLSHPHIVPVLAAGEVDGLLYYIMPYMEGRSLRARLREEGALGVAEAVRLLRNVAAALAYAHGRGIVHRDIKPDNIIVQDGIAVVLDFGVSKALTASTAAPAEGHTGAGLSIGTPRYMAPEQVAADPDLDARADLYAWGVLAYELLSGATPFGGTDPVRILRAHLTEPPRPIRDHCPAAPTVIASLVMRCLEKDRVRRPASATEILDLLDAIGTPRTLRAQMPAGAGHWARAVLLPAGGYLAAAAVTIFALEHLATARAIGDRVLVFSIVAALLGLPIAVGLGLVLGLRRAEREA